MESGRAKRRGGADQNRRRGGRHGVRRGDLRAVGKRRRRAVGRVDDRRAGSIAGNHRGERFVVQPAVEAELRVLDESQKRVRLVVVRAGRRNVVVLFVITRVDAVRDVPYLPGELRGEFLHDRTIDGQRERQVFTTAIETLFCIEI